MRVHVVLDDHLKSELRVPEKRDDERKHQHCIEWLCDKRVRRRIIHVQHRQHDPDEPDAKTEQRDRRNALDHEMVSAYLRGT